MKTIAFFNNKGGVGKTSLVYHLAWMYADLGLPVIAADFDPQANLSTMFLDGERLEVLWPDGEHPNTVLGAIKPILKGIGDIAEPNLESIDANLLLLVGDLGLSRFEDKLSDAWPRCHDRDESAFRIMSAFYRILYQAADRHQTEMVLIDVGPNLGAINRAALIAADYVAIPLAPDLFSQQGLNNLGPTLRDWRQGWADRKNKLSNSELPLPDGKMEPIGYIILQHGIHSKRPVKAYARWMARIPKVYRQTILQKKYSGKISVENDRYCRAMLKNYRSLMPLAMEAHKPMFHLRPADGAIGAHLNAVRACYDDFEALAHGIAKRCGILL